jgi:hypothetical protein
MQKKITLKVKMRKKPPGQVHRTQLTSASRLGMTSSKATIKYKENVIK